MAFSNFPEDVAIFVFLEAGAPRSAGIKSLARPDRFSCLPAPSGSDRNIVLITTSGHQTHSSISNWHQHHQPNEKVT